MDYELEVTRIDTDGGDNFGAYFEIDGVKCSFHWDVEWLLFQLLDGRTKETIIEEYSMDDED